MVVSDEDAIVMLMCLIIQTLTVSSISQLNLQKQYTQRELVARDNKIASERTVGLGAMSWAIKLLRHRDNESRQGGFDG